MKTKRTGAIFSHPDDVEWLKSTHLKDKTLNFKSYILYGNEDWPERLELHDSADPTVDDKFIAIEPVYNDDGSFA